MLFLYLLTAGRTLSGLRGRGRWKYPVYCCHGSQSRPWEAGGRQPLFPEASCFPDGCWRSGRPPALSCQGTLKTVYPLSSLRNLIRSMNPVIVAIFSTERTRNEMHVRVLILNSLLCCFRPWMLPSSYSFRGQIQ